MADFTAQSCLDQGFGSGSVLDLHFLSHLIRIRIRILNADPDTCLIIQPKSKNLNTIIFFFLKVKNTNFW